LTSRASGALRVALGIIALIAGTACVRAGRVPPPRWSADLAPLRVEGDTGVVDTIAHGALHRSFLVRQGPWAVHVLDVDRNACWTLVAVKGASGAAGRRKTSALASELSQGGGAVGGAVNADFFLFDPPGVPTGAHVSGGDVVTGPGARPVFAIGSDGRPWIGVLSVSGVAVSALDSIPIVSWNRLAPGGLAWFDARFGSTVDTSSGSVRVTMSSLRGLVQSIDTAPAPTPIPSSGGVLVLGPRVPAPVRARFLLAARARGRFDVEMRLVPVHPSEAVGGFPVLVHDSLEVPGLDSAGAVTFAPVRHPRTIVAVASRGRRILLVTIDGRQPGYSVGTTLRESARLALALGATEAINLDGGGSTTMVVARSSPDTTRFEVVNRPSDAQGERLVGNALVVTQRSASSDQRSTVGRNRSLQCR